MLDVGIRLRHLQCFLTIAQLRSVGRAAEALSITQPALSKTLRELEDVLQVRLFDRDPKGMLLTSFGKLFLQHAASSVTSLRRGIDDLKAMRSVGAPTLSVGVLPNAAPRVMPLALQVFHARFPGIRVHVVSGTNARLLDLLRLGELEMVVGRLAKPDQMLDVSFERLYSERLSIVVRRGHPLAAVRVARPAMFKAYPWILPAEGTIIGHEIRRYLIDHGVGTPPSIVETTMTEFGRGYVRRSDAIWFVPRGAAEPDITDGSLVELPADTDGLAGPVGVTTRAGTTLPPPALAMIEAIRAACRSRSACADNLSAMAAVPKIMRRAPRSSAKQSRRARPARATERK